MHRIGRTGRAGTPGDALSLVSAEEQADLKAIEKLLGRPSPGAPRPASSPRPPPSSRRKMPPHRRERHHHAPPPARLSRRQRPSFRG